MNLNNKKSTLIFSAIILIAVIFINLIGRNVFDRFDLTDNKMYSLSSSSKSVVKKIDDIFTIKVYFSEDLPAQYANNKRYLQDILEEYTAYSSGNLRFEFYSPDNDEQLAEIISILGEPKVKKAIEKTGDLDYASLAAFSVLKTQPKLIKFAPHLLKPFI